MNVRTLCALSLATCLAVCGLRAADSPTPEQIQKELALRQEALAKRYDAFEHALVSLIARLQTSAKEEDRALAGRLKKALEHSGKEDVHGKFDRLIQALNSSQGVDVGELKKALAEQKALASDIKVILGFLMDGDRHKKLQEEIANLRKVLKELERTIREQKIVRINTETDRVGKEALATAQVRVSDFTKNVAKLMGAPVPEGKPKPGAVGGSFKGAQQVHESLVPQQQAYQNIQKGQNAAASNDQDESLKKLEDARQQLEQYLRQLRDEEIERVLAALHARCERMLQLQVAVYTGTVQVDTTIAKSADRKPTRADEQKAVELSRLEDQIVVEVTKAIQLLEAEGSTVAFPELFKQLRDDMKHVGRRLGKADVGPVTQLIEKDLMAVLHEMVDSLKKAQDRTAAAKPGDKKPREPRLVEPIAEVKMVRLMQVRVNYRTSTYNDRYSDEKTRLPIIQQEMTNLADRQKRIADITTVLPKVKDQ